MVNMVIGHFKAFVIYILRMIKNFNLTTLPDKKIRFITRKFRNKNIDIGV